MKNTLCLLIFFTALLATTTCHRKRKARSDILQFTHGFYAGRCFDYCFQTVYITLNPSQVICEWSAPDYLDLPTKTTVATLLPFGWSALTDALRLQEFENSPSLIGCPNCVDEGAEWVQITWNTKEKRIDFEPNLSIPGNEDLVTNLRLFHSWCEFPE